MVCPHLIPVIWLKLWPCLNANVPEKSKKFNSYRICALLYTVCKHLAKKWRQEFESTIDWNFEGEYIWEWKNYEIQRLRIFNATKLWFYIFALFVSYQYSIFLKRYLKNANSHTSKVLQYFDVLYLAVSTLQFISGIISEESFKQ